ncbi:29532_t:CDS:2, partial [Racocetra persica]
VSGAKELLGGYNPLVWKANESRTNGSARTSDSFIFSLQSNDSPGFGSGDLRMGNDRNTSLWHCKSKYQ